MEKIRLSKRLEAVANFVPEEARIVDVGSDHAYLPLFLVESGRIFYAVAGEVVQGPYQSALANVVQAGQKENIKVRLADGLAAIEAEDRIDTITIAGMGGRLIVDILQASKDKLASVERLILQPNNREDDVRKWLADNGFSLIAEAIVEENDKIYEILVAESGRMTLSDKELRFGPFLLEESSSIFRKKWQKELDKLAHALAQIPDDNIADRSAISQKIKNIKEALHAS